jgi:protein involved in sex pheromone biosynthesis
MKKLCIAIVASLFILSACGKKSEHNHEAADTTGTHKHADGAVHKNHEPKMDSIKQDTTAHRHSHEH